MKLTTQLFINNQPVPQHHYTITLNLFSAGSGVFRVETREKKPITGKIEFFCGYNGQPLRQLFLGFIQSAQILNETEQLLTCKEFAALLQLPMSLALRNVTLPDVLDEMANVSGLIFTALDTDYSQTPTPFFYHNGNGLHAVASLNQVFNIPQFFRQQKTNGTQWVGSWQDSPWVNKPLALPARFFQNTNAQGGQKLTFIPQIRPGALLGDGRIVHWVQFENGNMNLQAKQNPWAGE